MNGIRRAFRSLTTMPPPIDGHYRVIDLLRGLAAIAILLWHYQSFQYVHPEQAIPVAELYHQPFAGVLWPFYTLGFYAVQLFWTISGFVFAAVYMGRERSTRSFVVARFARLYPLHLITLCVVAGLQLISLRQTGTTKIFAHNDAYHFVLQLFMASNWGFERGLSFNGPIWSVSVEIVIYAVFWLVHRQLFRFGVVGPALLSLVFMVAVSRGADSKIVSCGFYFFAGATLYVVHRSLAARLQAVAAAGLAIVGVLLLRHQLGHALTGLILAAVLASAVAEHHLGRRAGALHWIGDSTYSLYLWHIPVEIALMLTIADPLAYRSPAFLTAFLVGMMIVARVSFVTIERPLRDAIGRRLRSPAPGAASTALSGQS